jgi:beta-glucosidase-like glycosyl hydrolase
MVLLKNGKSTNNPLLPLDKNASKILVAGTHSDNLGYQCGGWTLEWQGLSGNSTIGEFHYIYVRSITIDCHIKS